MKRVAKVITTTSGSYRVEFNKLKGSMLFLEFIADTGIQGQSVRIEQNIKAGTMIAFVAFWTRDQYAKCAEYINLNS